MNFIISSNDWNKINQIVGKAQGVLEGFAVQGIEGIELEHISLINNVNEQLESISKIRVDVQEIK